MLRHGRSMLIAGGIGFLDLFPPPLRWARCPTNSSRGKGSKNEGLGHEIRYGSRVKIGFHTVSLDTG